MSDHDPAPDPIDKAYDRAEAMLSDAEARAARRARVLAAVAREPAATAPAARRPAWRPGGWLAAASVAGLAVFAATQIYQPPPRQPPAAPATPGPVARGIEAPPTPSAATPSKAPAPGTFAPAPPPAPIAPAPRAFPAPPPPPPPPPPPAAPPAYAPGPEMNVPPPLSGVAGEEAADAQLSARRAEKPAAPAPPIVAAPLSKSQATAGLLFDPAERLRAAAAAGRTAEVKALLAQGVPVDGSDAEGDTALMNAVRADRPAAAALLRRHGASLDRRNHAGESARDLANEKGDAALDEALDLTP